MGQKVHPLGFRLGITQKHESRWFTQPKQYPIFIQQDRFVRTFLGDKCQKVGIAKIVIQRILNQVRVFVTLQRPDRRTKKFQGHPKNHVAFFANLKELRTDLEKKLNQFTLQHVLSNPKYNFFQEEFLEQPSKVSIFVKRKRKIDSSLIASSLVKQLEKRVAFRQAIRQAVREAQNDNVLQGLKIQISGRLNGAEMARTEWVRQGRVPLQTLRANMDYCYTTAKTIYGLLGIKIWIFLGDQKVIQNKKQNQMKR
jgi:small subunit ribosomal protein S3